MTGWSDVQAHGLNVQHWPSSDHSLFVCWRASCCAQEQWIILYDHSHSLTLLCEGLVWIGVKD